MTKDQDERKDRIPEREPGSGACEERKERSSNASNKTSKSPGEDDEEVNSPGEVEIFVVDEILDTTGVDETVEETTNPETQLSREVCRNLTAPVLRGVFGVGVVENRVSHQVSPEQALNLEVEGGSTSGFTGIGVPVARSVSTETVSHSVEAQVAPSKEVKKNEDFKLTTVKQSIRKITHSVSQTMTPQQSTIEQTQKLDEEDPTFSWSGGSPYGSGKPKLVIHKSDEDLDTLPFLQVLLRDTYKEMVGGEPDAEAVEFVANEPRIPSVQKSIVTLDMTGEEWKAEMQGDTPVVRHNSYDIVPELRDIASTLYTGELGYFVVSAPREWESQADFVGESFFENLITRIAGTDSHSGNKKNTGAFERLDSTPVVLAEPDLETSEGSSKEHSLREKIALYFGFDHFGNTSTVPQIEETKERVLRKNDWKRVVLTERQKEGNGESDEHYFWKSAIAEGVAREIWYENRDIDAEQSFEEFFEEKLLEKEVVKTESRNDNRVTDIEVNIDSSMKISGAVERFLNIDEIESNVFIEFETGRSEGAYNFRKIRETIEKYDDTDEYLSVVFPPRLLFRGKKRARMIIDLVNNWDGNGYAYVPKLKRGYCNSLRPAKKVVNNLYGGEKDE